jgi:hypothetical protein
MPPRHPPKDRQQKDQKSPPKIKRQDAAKRNRVGGKQDSTATATDDTKDKDVVVPLVDAPISAPLSAPPEAVVVDCPVAAVEAAVVAPETAPISDQVDAPEVVLPAVAVVAAPEDLGALTSYGVLRTNAFLQTPGLDGVPPSDLKLLVRRDACRLQTTDNTTGRSHKHICLFCPCRQFVFGFECDWRERARNVELDRHEIGAVGPLWCPNSCY